MAVGATILAAGDAKGGALAIAADRSQSVYLPPVPGKYEWRLPRTLSPGWREVTVFFGPATNSNYRQYLETGPSGHISVDLGLLDPSHKSPSVHFYIHNSTPLTQVQVRSDDKSLPTQSIARIEFEDVDSPKDAGQVCCIEESTSPDGKMIFPAGSPAGNWEVKLWSSGGSRTLTVVTNDDRAVNAPIISNVNVYTSSAPRSITFAPPSGLDETVLVHFPPSDSAVSLIWPRQPLAVFNPSERETVLFKLIGLPQGGALPTFPQLPNDAQLAVVTSWDDGPSSDERCAILLRRYGFKGTFFVTQTGPIRSAVKKIEELGMEVGSHTLTHPRAWLIDPEQWSRQCLQMRLSLEETLEHSVLSFAYPYDHVPAYDESGDYVLRGVAGAGYWSGRTTKLGFETIGGYSHPLNFVTNGYFKNNVPALQSAWEKASSTAGGVFYFWGHSWDNKTEQDWTDFDALLQRFSNKPGVWYATQGQLFLWRWLKTNARIDRSAGDGMEIVLSYPKLDPYWAAQCPISLKVPGGVTEVFSRGRNLPITKGVVTLPATPQ